MANPATGCTCGSGGHPRKCDMHPEAYRLHVALLNVEAILDSEGLRASIESADRMYACVDELEEAAKEFGAQAERKKQQALVAELERKLEAAQAHAAERVAEQRAHAAAAHAEAAELRAKLADMALMTPLDGDARKHLVDKLDEQRWAMERELAEALGEDYRGLKRGDDPWRDMLAMVRERFP